MSNRRNFICNSLILGCYFIIKKSISCEITPVQPKGPFYKKNISASVQDLTNQGKAAGRKIEISGKVLDKNCEPHKNSKIKVWQANAYGRYHHKRDYSANRIDKNFFGYSFLKTNNDGFYKFTTVIPGAYNIAKDIIRPPHIHFSVQTSQGDILHTQLYFKDHPLNKTDFLFNKVKNKSSLELLLKKSKDNDIPRGTFNFVI